MLAAFPPLPAGIFFCKNLPTAQGKCWGKVLMPLECLCIVGQTPDLQDSIPPKFYLTYSKPPVRCALSPLAPRNLHLQTRLSLSYYSTQNCHGRTGDMNPKRLPQGLLPQHLYETLGHALTHLFFVPKPE